MTGTFGEVVRAARDAAGMSLRALGAAMGGLSAPYLHDVEHDRRRLAPAHWRALVAALPALTIRDLAEAAVRSGPVQIDGRELTARQRAGVVEALERAAA